METVVAARFVALHIFTHADSESLPTLKMNFQNFGENLWCSVESLHGLPHHLGNICCHFLLSRQRVCISFRELALVAGSALVYTAKCSCCVIPGNVRNNSQTSRFHQGSLHVGPQRLSGEHPKAFRQNWRNSDETCKFLVCKWAFVDQQKNHWIRKYLRHEKYWILQWDKL